MFIIDIFSKVNQTLSASTRKEEGLYLHLLFPISFAFLITFLLSRFISHLVPWLYVPIVPGLHIHHYAYGFFVLIISGYLALLFDTHRARYLISLLHGMGIGLALDEFGMWLRLSDEGAARWSYDGALVMAAIILLIFSIRPGLKMARVLGFLGPKKAI